MLTQNPEIYSEYAVPAFRVSRKVRPPTRGDLPNLKGLSRSIHVAKAPTIDVVTKREGADIIDHYGIRDVNNLEQKWETTQQRREKKAKAPSPLRALQKYELEGSIDTFKLGTFTRAIGAPLVSSEVERLNKDRKAIGSILSGIVGSKVIVAPLCEDEDYYLYLGSYYQEHETEVYPILKYAERNLPPAVETFDAVFWPSQVFPPRATA